MYRKNKVERINWFLNFLNVDLEIIPLGEKMKLTTDAISIVLGYSSFVFEGKKIGLMPAGRWGESIPKTMERWTKEDKLQRCQENLKSFFEKMMENRNAAFAHSKKGWTTASKAKHFFPLAEFESDIKFRMETPIIETELRLKNENEPEGELESKLTPEALSDSPIQLAYRASTDEDTLLFYFCQDLEGVPLRSLRQCQECKNWFFHVSKKIKLFCSNNCAARKVSRERRKRIKENEPKKYKKELASGAERARKSYEKKLKELYGKEFLYQVLEDVEIELPIETDSALNSNEKKIKALPMVAESTLKSREKQDREKISKAKIGKRPNKHKS